MSGESKGSGRAVYRNVTPTLLEVRQPSRAVAEPVDLWQAREIEHVQEQVVQRGFLPVDEMPVALQPSVGTSGKNNWQIIVHVDHQLGVLLVVVGNRARPFDVRQLDGDVLLFGALNPALDVADGLEIFL